MSKKEENRKSFYGTLLASMLSISTAFFIIHINAYGRPVPHGSYSQEIIGRVADHVNYLPLSRFIGALIILGIFAIALLIPIRLWFRYKKKLNNRIVDNLLVITIGAFPFFIQNCIATILLWLNKEACSANFAYTLIYLIALPLYILWIYLKDRPKKL